MRAERFGGTCPRRDCVISLAAQARTRRTWSGGTACARNCSRKWLMRYARSFLSVVTDEQVFHQQGLVAGGCNLGDEDNVIRHTTVGWVLLDRYECMEWPISCIEREHVVERCRLEVEQHIRVYDARLPSTRRSACPRSRTRRSSRWQSLRGADSGSPHRAARAPSVRSPWPPRT